jgi:hypothetical protein
MKGDASDGATAIPSTSGSNNIPHEPCSLGRAIDFSLKAGRGFAAVGRVIVALIRYLEAWLMQVWRQGGFSR